MTNKLNELLDIIGIEDYQKVFNTILTDNGPEFSDISGIIQDPLTGEIKTDLFFCHPYSSFEKGACEKNHELLRYILPKGTSFENLTQDKLNIIMSHINSYKRKSTDYSTPIDLFCATYGPKILTILKIKKIKAQEVTLSNQIIK